MLGHPRRAPRERRFPRRVRLGRVHDEIVVECAEAVAEDVCERVEACMEAAGREYIKSIPVVVDATVAEAWIK